MNQAEIIAMKKATQRTRLKTLKDLKRTDNTVREIKSLIQILELTHEAIGQANFHLDLLDLNK